MLHKQILSNGITLVTYDMPSVKSFHVGISAKGGSLVEDPKKNGLAHYMEHMLVQGIPSFPDAQSMSNFIESVSGTYNAYTSALTVHFMIHVPFSHAEDAIRIASEVFFQPLFPEAAIEKERQAVLSEITQELDSRWYKFQEFFRQVRFSPDSLLQNKTVGSLETVRNISREDLIEYWQSYFSPQNTYLFIGGNFKQKQIEKLVGKHFNQTSKGKKFTGFPELTVAKDLQRYQVAIRNDPALQSNYVDILFPSLEMNDSPKLQMVHFLIHTILGRLRSSRLFKILRYEKGLVYSVSTSTSEWPGLGYSSAYSEVRPEFLEEVVQILVNEIHTFMHQGPTQEELDFAKNFLKNQWLMAFDNPSSIAGWIENQFLWRDKILLPEDEIKMLEKITIKNLLDLMKDKWDMKKVQLIIQGPLEESDVNKKKFDKILKKLLTK